MEITKDTTIENLVNEIPEANAYLREQGIRCIVCGEPIWGTLEEAAMEKGFNEEQIQVFVNDLNDISKNPPAKDYKFQKRFDAGKLNL